MTHCEEPMYGGTNTDKKGLPTFVDMKEDGGSINI